MEKNLSNPTRKYFWCSGGSRNEFAMHAAVRSQRLRDLEKPPFYAMNWGLGLGHLDGLRGDFTRIWNRCNLQMILCRVGSSYLLIGQCFLLVLPIEKAGNKWKTSKAKIQWLEICLCCLVILSILLSDWSDMVGYSLLWVGWIFKCLCRPGCII